MKERFLNVDQFIFDINKYEESTINDFVNQYFSILSSKIGKQLTFEYQKTDKGYCYKILRYEKYLLQGNSVKDVDCALITGFTVADFQTNPIMPNKNAKARCIIPWYDGCYVPEQEIEGLYSMMIGANNAEQPVSVKIHAFDSYLSVTVEYGTANPKVIDTASSGSDVDAVK